METRNPVNNWFLLAGVGIVSWGGALVYALVGEDSPVVLWYFMLASTLLAAVAWVWFRHHPPLMNAPAWAYALVLALLQVGGMVGGALLPGAVGASLAVGSAFVLYGLLERSPRSLPGGEDEVFRAGSVRRR